MSNPQNGDTARAKISIVIPVFNEVGSIASLCNEIDAALDGWDYETIFVDDGSTDATADVLAGIAGSKSHVSAIVLAANFGQSAALAAGIAEAVGDIIVTMDGDGQNDPADIPALLRKLDDGYEVVSGWRRRRVEPLLRRRIPSMAANRLIDMLMGAGVHDNGCGLKAYRRELLQELKIYGEGHRIVLAQAAQLGGRIAEVEVNDRPRVHGKSKYGLSRTYKVALDLLALKFLSSYAFNPIRVFGGFGLVCIAAAFALALGLLVWRFTSGGYIIQTPLLLLSAVLLLMGLFLLLMGLLAELVVRVYNEIHGGPVYRVRRKLRGPDKGSK